MRTAKVSKWGMICICGVYLSYWLPHPGPLHNDFVPSVLFAEMFASLSVTMWNATRTAKCVSFSMSLVGGMKVVLCGWLPGWTTWLSGSQGVVDSCPGFIRMAWSLWGVLVENSKRWWAVSSGIVFLPGVVVHLPSTPLSYLCHGKAFSRSASLPLRIRVASL